MDERDSNHLFEGNPEDCGSENYSSCLSHSIPEQLEINAHNDSYMVSDLNGTPTPSRVNSNPSSDAGPKPRQYQALFKPS